MDNLVMSNIRIVRNHDTLSDSQKVQFNKIIMEGLKGKFSCALHNDIESMLKTVNLWVELELLPLNETFTAIDSNTGDVVALVLLNNFKRTSNLTFLHSFIKSVGNIGFINTTRIFFSFVSVDICNKKLEDNQTLSEIYLIVTREDLRGKGIGTLLMNYVIEYVHSKYSNEVKDAYKKIRLLVFAKNPAKRLYERLGFKQVSSVATPNMVKSFGQEYDELVCMEKVIFN